MLRPRSLPNRDGRSLYLAAVTAPRLEVRKVVEAGANLCRMNAKEEPRERVETLSDQQVEQLLEALEDVQPGDVIDAWGNLSAFARASSASVFRHLDEEEDAIGFSWEKYR